MTTDEIRRAIKATKNGLNTKLPLHFNVVEELCRKADAYDALIAPQSAKQARQLAREVFR